MQYYVLSLIQIVFILISGEQLSSRNLPSLTMERIHSMNQSCNVVNTRQIMSNQMLAHDHCEMQDNITLQSSLDTISFRNLI